MRLQTSSTATAAYRPYLGSPAATSCEGAPNADPMPRSMPRMKAWTGSKAMSDQYKPDTDSLTNMDRIGGCVMIVVVIWGGFLLMGMI